MPRKYEPLDVDHDEYDSKRDRYPTVVPAGLCSCIALATLIGVVLALLLHGSIWGGDDDEGTPKLSDITLAQDTKCDSFCKGTLSGFNFSPNSTAAVFSGKCAYTFANLPNKYKPSEQKPPGYDDVLCNGVPTSQSAITYKGCAYGGECVLGITSAPKGKIIMHYAELAKSISYQQGSGYSIIAPGQQYPCVVEEMNKACRPKQGTTQVYDKTGYVEDGTLLCCCS